MLPAPAAAAAAPPEALVALRRVEQRQRFAKTIAELERYQAAATPLEEPGARVVPRPALARPASSAAAGLPWSRLWARRKDPAPGMTPAGAAPRPGSRWTAALIAARRLWVTLALLLDACHPAAEHAGAAARLDRLNLPAGFAIAAFARVPGARSLLAAEDGAKIYVATRDSEVCAILDPERDGDCRTRWSRSRAA